MNLFDRYQNSILFRNGINFENAIKIYKKKRKLHRLKITMKSRRKRKNYYLKNV